MSIVDPHFYYRVIVCADVSGDVNDELQSRIDDLENNQILAFRPFDPALAISGATFISGADCTSNGGEVRCTDGASSAAVPLSVRNLPTGRCYQADPGTLGNSYRTPSSPDAPCFVSEPVPVDVELASISIHATEVVLSANYSTEGTLVGLGAAFVTTADARAASFDSRTRVIGGQSLYSVLAAGGAFGASCSNRDDRDTDDFTNSGFWMYFEFEAEPVVWNAP